jgi:hypothetical protein
MSSSVSSSEPGMEFSSSLRLVTSKNVSAMMQNRAVPESTPQAISSTFFMLYIGR